MSATVAHAPPAPLNRPSLAARLLASPPWAWVAACAVVAALSLVGPSNLTYDAWYWLIWGREILHLDLNTVVGSSWKPLPALVDATYAWTGSSVAPMLWLWIARTGGLLALAALVRVGIRLGGLVAGAAALLLFLLAAHPDSEFGVVTFLSVGWSDLLTVAAAGWALDRHLAGRHAPALWLLAVAALVRPEAWALLLGYAIWCRRARRVGTPALLVAVVGVPLLWLVPDYLGSRHPLARSSPARADQGAAAPGTRENALGVLGSLRSLLILPTKLAVLGAAALAVWRRDRLWLGLVGILVAWVVVVAVMDAAGYPGLERFLATPLALACVLAGAGLAAGLAALRDWRWRAAAAVAVLALFAAFSPAPIRAIVHHLYLNKKIIETEDQLPSAVDGARRAGLERCRLVAAGAYAVPIVRWYTDRSHVAHSVTGADLVFYLPNHEHRPQPPISAGQLRAFRLVAPTSQWRVLSRCPAQGPPAPTD